MKLTDFNTLIELNKESLVFVVGGNSTSSKKNDTRHDSDRTDGKGCTDHLQLR